jgi:nitrate reductase NapE component
LAKDGGRDCRPLVTRNKCGSSSTSSQWQLHKCPFLRSWAGNSLERDRRVSKCKFDIVAKTKQYQGCISSTRHISSIVFLLFCVYPLLSICVLFDQYAKLWMYGHKKTMASLKHWYFIRLLTRTGRSLHGQVEQHVRTKSLLST